MLMRYGQKNASWIDLVAPTPAEVRSLMHEFGIDPLIAEELLVPSFKPKVERRGDVLYIILHFPIMRGSGRQEQEVDFVVGKNFLITTRYETVDPLHAFAQAFEVSTVLGHPITQLHGGHLFISMTRALYEALINESQTLKRRLEDIEERIFKGDERQMVIELSHIAASSTISATRLCRTRRCSTRLSPRPRASSAPSSPIICATSSARRSGVQRSLDNLHSSMIELRETNNSLLSTKQTR